MENEPKKQYNQYAKFSALAIQMGAIIGGSVWLGTYLDSKYNKGGTGWTVFLSLFGVASSLYYVLKEVIRITNSNDKNNTK